jgi:hypothetical protein
MRADEARTTGHECASHDARAYLGVFARVGPEPHGN